MEVRVRFAPSPTGFLHIGGVRTALFNWLFARHEGGKFIVRIEDTDKQRSEKRFEEDVLKNLEWLGLASDEPIVRQSERLDIYERTLKKLFEEKRVYFCFCSTEELEAEYEAQLSQGLVPKYSGKCRALSPAAAAEKLRANPGVVRFKMAEKTVAFTDMIRGKVEFNTGLFGDIIIAKSMREPLYNFASVVDDADMGITHVIRGEEHLSNTPKQMMLQEALGLPTPRYAHLPLILGPDKKKLSKRFLTNSINDYRSQGYLPSALLNFLVLLGWHPTDNREVLTVPEMVEAFSIKRVQKAGAIYNPEKLDWMNSMHIRAMDEKALAEHLASFVPEHWAGDRERLTRAIALVKDRMKNLADFRKEVGFIFELADYKPSMLVWKQATSEKTAERLEHARALLAGDKGSAFPSEGTEAALMQYANEEGRGDVLWPLRVALSGQEASPGPVELLRVLGKRESDTRIGEAIGKLRTEL